MTGTPPLIGAGPDLGQAVARRFGQGGRRVVLAQLYWGLAAELRAGRRVKAEYPSL